MCRSTAEGGRRCRCSEGKPKRSGERARYALAKTPSQDDVAVFTAPESSAPLDWDAAKTRIGALTLTVKEGLTRPASRESDEEWEQRIEAGLAAIVESGEHIQSEIETRHPVMCPADAPPRSKSEEYTRVAIAQRDWVVARAQVTTEVLSEIRSMGSPDGLALSPTSTQKYVEHTNGVANWFPTDWIAASNDHEIPLHIQKARNGAHYLASHRVTVTKGRRTVTSSEEVMSPPHLYSFQARGNGDVNSREEWEQRVGEEITVTIDTPVGSKGSKRKVLEVLPGEPLQIRVSGSKTTVFIEKEDDRTLPDGTEMVPTGDLFKGGMLCPPGNVMEHRSVSYDYQDGYGIIEWDDGTYTTFAPTDRVTHLNSRTERVAQVTTNGSDGDTVHELTHRMEDVHRDIRTAEAMFLEPRLIDPETGMRRSTTGNKKELLTPGTPFAHEYMTREYQTGDREVLSCGMEAIFAGRFGGLEGRQRYQADPEHRQFVLGTLATV